MSPSKSASPSGKSPDPLDLDGFIDPDDQGLSLDELSRAYAAILNKGADPYPQPVEPARATDQAAEPTDVIAGADNVACEITPKSILEAMLFVGHPTGEPLLSERIAALMRGGRASEIDGLVAELNAEFQQQGVAYWIASEGAGYRLTLRPEFAGLCDAFHGRIREARLSQPAIDVLAIVAYHQP